MEFERVYLKADEWVVWSAAMKGTILADLLAVMTVYLQVVNSVYPRVDLTAVLKAFSRVY